MLKGLGNLAGLMKQAQQIGGQIQGLNDELKTKKTVGSAGAGMVEIEMNGLLEVLRCRIDPKIVNVDDRELLEDLIAAATNQAVSKARELHAEALKSLTGGLELPGLQDALSKLTGGGNISP